MLADDVSWNSLYILSVVSVLLSDSVWSFLLSLIKDLSVFIFSTDQFLVLSILIFLVSTFIFALIFILVIPETLNFFLVALVTALNCVFVRCDCIPILSPLKLLSCVPEIWGHCFHFRLSPCVWSVLIASSTHYLLRILFCLHVFPVILIYFRCLILVVGKDAWYDFSLKFEACFMTYVTYSGECSVRTYRMWILYLDGIFLF